MARNDCDEGRLGGPKAEALSVTVVTVLAIGGVFWVFTLTALLALLRVAAHSDAQLEDEQERQVRPLRERAVAEFAPAGRFARLRDGRPTSSDRPIVR
jgi:hypothetical protein